MTKLSSAKELPSSKIIMREKHFLTQFVFEPVKAGYSHVRHRRYTWKGVSCNVKYREWNRLRIVRFISGESKIQSCKDSDKIRAHADIENDEEDGVITSCRCHNNRKPIADDSWCLVYSTFREREGGSTWSPKVGISVELDRCRKCISLHNARDCGVECTRWSNE